MEELLKTFALTPLDAVMILVSCPLFFLLWRILDTVCFKHFSHLLDVRENATHGKEDESKRLISKAQDLTATYDLSLKEAREKYGKEKEAKLEIARKEANEIVAKTAQEIEQIIKQGKQKNQQLMVAASTELKSRTDSLASGIVDKVIALSN